MDSHHIARGARRLTGAGLAALLVVGLAGCGDEEDATDGGVAEAAAGRDAAAPDDAAGDPEVSEAWARSSAAGQDDGAAYLVVVGGPEDDRLVGVTVPPEVAASVELHETVAAEGGAGTMTMREVDGVDVPAGATVAFEPGGYHVMLLGLAEPLVAGESFPIDVAFAGGATRTVTAEVRDR